MYLVTYKKHHRENLWNELTINEEGVASAVCMFSRPGMPIRNLGHFRLELAADITTKIQECVKRYSLHDKSIIATPPLSGRRLTEIRLLRDNRWIENSFPGSGPTPEPLVEFENIMVEIMREVSMNPLRAFRIENKFNFSQVFPGELVEIEFHMANDGRLPVKVFSPASLSKPGGCTLNFLVWAIPSSTTKDADYYTTFETTDMEFKVTSHEALQSDQDYLYFEPGEKLVSKISFKFPKYKAGKYQFQLVYISFAEFGKDISLVTGAYHGIPVDVEVGKA